MTDKPLALIGLVVFSADAEFPETGFPVNGISVSCCSNSLRGKTPRKSFDPLKHKVRTCHGAVRFMVVVV